MTNTLELYDKVFEVAIIKMLLKVRVSSLKIYRKIKILNKEIEGMRTKWNFTERTRNVPCAQSACDLTGRDKKSLSYRDPNEQTEIHL